MRKNLQEIRIDIVIEKDSAIAKERGAGLGQRTGSTVKSKLKPKTRWGRSLEVHFEHLKDPASAGHFSRRPHEELERMYGTLDTGVRLKLGRFLKPQRLFKIRLTLISNRGSSPPRTTDGDTRAYSEAMSRRPHVIYRMCQSAAPDRKNEPPVRGNQ
ncbi:hypothetical protein EVAR_43941_1 [Eumeta japonica]|uniref:Uncharacterized protein n=1 Tax=Eumeta variegata TaxID=151549 RepID=A0A4C1WPF7_EUMVA|nr:hypothetical protein EVAR_43941_1 [Eumeta japonica]